MKRIFDIVVAGLALIVLAPLLLLIALLIKLDSRGPILFKQERIGKGFRPFSIYKFRTMRDGVHATSSLTIGADPRITRAGKYLRASKIDELPQLLNIVKGDMSLVGPRPEVPQYVELFRQDDEEILKMRPGITDLASIKYRDEATLLGQSENPQEEYVTRVLPDKINLGKEYIRRSSVFFDLTLMFKTFLRLFDRVLASQNRKQIRVISRKGAK